MLTVSTSRVVMDALLAAMDAEATIVVATHDQTWIERYHPNVLRLDHGRVVQ